MTLDSTLAPLKDVSGIIGSFVIGKAGVVLARDLPSILDNGALTEAGQRVERLFDALEDAEWSAIQYSEHRLYVKKVDIGFLCVIAALETSLPALRMASTLVSRKLVAASKAGRVRDVDPMPAPNSVRTSLVVQTPGTIAPLAPRGQHWPPTIPSGRQPPALPTAALPQTETCPEGSTTMQSVRDGARVSKVEPIPLTSRTGQAPEARGASTPKTGSRYRIFRGRRYEV